MCEIATTTKKNTLLTDVRYPVMTELALAEQCIRENLQSSVSLIKQISEHLIQSGGKRLRMLVVLLVAKAFGYSGKTAHIQLAAVIELLHTATLLHDDVVDASELRRGNPTANKIWGEQASVLVGDYLYSRAFQIIVQVKNFSVLEILAQASNQMAEGEIQQLVNCHNPDILETNYIQVLHNKTGTLFSAAAQIGAILTQDAPEIIHAMNNYGAHLGIAFQLIDDALDYQGCAEQMGKNIGEDLAEGKPTLPLLHALCHASSSEQQILRDAIQFGKKAAIPQIIDIVISTQSIAYTYQRAYQQAQNALSYLSVMPPSIYREALVKLVEFAVNRKF